jgi:hypothetical protein
VITGSPAAAAATKRRSESLSIRYFGRKASVPVRPPLFSTYTHPVQDPTMRTHSERRVGRLTGPLSRLEKRDWQLWVMVSFTGIVASAGLLVILIGAAFRFEMNVSRSLVIGLFVLLALLNSYLLTKRLPIRRVRASLILTTLEWNPGGLHPQLRRQTPWQSRAPHLSGAPEPLQPCSDCWNQGRD